MIEYVIESILEAMEKPSARILLVEDEQIVRMGLEENLAYEGYSVISAENGLEGLETFKREKPDLVITDVMMPGIDGFELCKRIRSEEFYTPIIMLTAKGTEVDKVVGLEIGADDYLTKPFAMRELFARVKAILRRANISSTNGTPKKPEKVAFGQVFVDFQTYRATREGEEIELSAKEFELLRYLSSNPDVPVTRNQLLDQVWGYNSYPTTRTVDNFIARLRHKIEELPEKPKHILTVHGVGYKFVA